MVVVGTSPLSSKKGCSTSWIVSKSLFRGHLTRHSVHRDTSLTVSCSASSLAALKFSSWPSKESFETAMRMSVFAKDLFAPWVAEVTAKGLRPPLLWQLANFDLSWLLDLLRHRSQATDGGCGDGYGCSGGIFTQLHKIVYMLVITVTCLVCFQR